MQTLIPPILETPISASLITGLGTAALVNTGTIDGTVPLIGSGGTLSGGVIPDLSATYLPLIGGTLTGSLSFYGTSTTILGDYGKIFIDGPLSITNSGYIEMNNLNIQDVGTLSFYGGGTGTILGCKGITFAGDGFTIDGFNDLVSDLVDSGGMVTTSALSTTLSNYVSNSYLSGTLSNYAPIGEFANYLPLAGGTMSGGLSMAGYNVSFAGGGSFGGYSGGIASGETFYALGGINLGGSYSITGSNYLSTGIATSGSFQCNGMLNLGNLDMANDNIIDVRNLTFNAGGTFSDYGGNIGVACGLIFGSESGGYIDMEANPIKGASVVGYYPTTAPSPPSEGMTYWDSTAHVLKVYNGTAWKIVTVS